MPTRINLGSGIFDKAKRRQATSNAISKTLVEYARYVPVQQIESKPTGKVYKRKGGRGFTRSHRASARGQRPAPDTGKLSRSTKHKKTGELKGEVTTIAKNKGFDYSAHLENDLGRPIQNAPADIKAAQDILIKNAEAAIAKLV